MERHYIVPFHELPSVRAAIVKGEALSPDILESFALSCVSPSDVAMLRKVVCDRDDGDRAGWACLALYAAGGIGDLSTELRPWLFAEDNGDRIHTAGPVVLASCAKDLFDATACRVLLEFADRYPVRLELEPLLQGFENDSALVAFLRGSRVAQIDQTLASPRLTQNRKAWLLRTYIDSSLVQTVLRDLAVDGSLYALASLFFLGDSLSWRLFGTVRAEGNAELQILCNLVHENLARGADRGYLLSVVCENNPAVRSALNDALGYCPPPMHAKVNGARSPSAHGVRSPSVEGAS